MNYTRNGEITGENTFFELLKQDGMTENEYESAIRDMKSGNTILVGRDDEDFNIYFIS